MRKIFLLAMTSMLVACSTSDQNPSEKIGDEVGLNQAGDRTEVSIDWVGTYRGVVPCADCAGIDMTLKLYEDGRYHIERDYQDRDTVADENGRFEWINGGPEIRLTDTNAQTLKAFVGEAYVQLYYADGSQPTGERAKDLRLYKD